MSARAKHFTFNATTRALWRAAENGEASEVAATLARGVDVNARNEHGMTALMRAARFGHAAVVHVLIEHGADPNLARNDKFTALALAAFFGHTETVRMLIENGAKTEVVTRFGTSPRMWAAARTFTEAARCIDEKVPAPPVRVRPTRVPMPTPMPTSKPAAIPEIRTLKDPPEIWDLVHEAPRGFNPRSAFISRLESMNRVVLIGAFAGLLFAVACGVAALVLGGSQARDLSTELPPVKTVSEVAAKPVVPVETQVVATPTVNTAEQSPVQVVRKAPVTHQSRLRPFVDVNVAQAAAPIREEPQVATPQIEKPKPRESPMNNPQNTVLSPHLIAPAKSAAPKAKVIQWP